MIYVIVGRREQGKTTLALYVTRKATARVLFDPRGLMPTAPTQLRVTKPVQLREAFDDLWTDTSNGVARDLVITPDGDVQEMFIGVSRQIKGWVKEPGARELAVVLDEARFLDLHIEAFDWILRCATRGQVSIVLTAHRPKDITVDVRAITDVWAFFRMTQRHDLDVVEEVSTDAVAALVSRLPNRHFVAWDDTRAVAKVYTNPTMWHSPLVQAGTGQPADLATFPEGEKDLDNNLSLLRQSHE